jgi:hypothetical protein
MLSPALKINSVAIIGASCRKDFRVEAGFQCAGCGEWNVTAVDESAGRRQSYIEDCQVCCKPNVLQLEYDTSSQEFFIMAELE